MRRDLLAMAGVALLACIVSGGKGSSSTLTDTLSSDMPSGEIEPVPSVSLDPVEPQFKSANDVKIRVTWSNPTPVAVRLETIGHESNPHDLAWNRVKLVGAGLAYKRSDYSPYLDVVSKTAVVSWCMDPIWTLPPQTVKSDEIPLRVFLDPSSIEWGKHEICWTAEFSYTVGDDPARRPRRAKSKGAFQFVTTASGQR